MRTYRLMRCFTYVTCIEAQRDNALQDLFKTILLNSSIQYCISISVLLHIFWNFQSFQYLKLVVDHFSKKNGWEAGCEYQRNKLLHKSLQKKKKIGHSVIQLTFTKLRGNTGSNRVERLLKIEQNLADLLFLQEMQN